MLLDSLPMKTTIPVFTIGIDLGDKKHAICVLDAEGEIIDERTITNHRESLRRLGKKYPEARVALEVGSHSPWISRFLGRTRIGSDCSQCPEAARDLPERPQKRRARRPDASQGWPGLMRSCCIRFSTESEQAQRDLLQVKLRDNPGAPAGRHRFIGALHTEESGERELRRVKKLSRT